MNLRKRSKKRGSVFTLLLQSYILFTFLIVIILCFSFLVFLVRSSRNLPVIEAAELSDYNQILEEGDYDAFPTDELLGDSGFIAVLDKDGKQIYGSAAQADVKVNYRKADLEYIPLYRDAMRIHVRELTDRQGEKNTAVAFRWYEENETKYEEYVFDENYRVLYASKELPEPQLTVRAFRLLSDTADDQFSVQKYCFQSDSKEELTLLLYQSKSFDQVLATRMGRAFRGSAWLFGLSYCILIGLFIHILNRKIKKPLKMLCEALNRFSGREGQSVFYEGPREFVDICDSFNDMSRRLEESETLRKKLELDKQKMLADISHDLKTPITVMRGYAKALNDGVVPLTEQPQYLATIEQKAEGLNELIDTFYGYSKMEHPDYSLTLENADICNYLRDYIADRYNELDLAGFEIEVDIPETHILCDIDTVQLKRVFENVMANSMKHNQGGITLYCGLKQQGDWVRILLGDNGTGIPAELRDTIFDPFVVGEKSRSKQGSGLGLSIAKRITETHGGTIRLLDQGEECCMTAFEILILVSTQKVFP